MVLTRIFAIGGALFIVNDFGVFGRLLVHELQIYDTVFPRIAAADTINLK